MSITLVLADDHPLILKGLEHLFSQERDFTVLAACKDGEEALGAVRRHRPDVLILDMRMPGKDGLAVLREMKTEGLPTRAVLLCAELEVEQWLEATRLGVGGVVLKEMAPELLVTCVRKVHAGEPWLERRTAALAFETLLRRETGMRELAGVLTPREIQIARLVANGLENKAIGDALAVSEGTVKTHLHNIYDKLHVGSRVELALYCRDKGVV